MPIDPTQADLGTAADLESQPRPTLVVVHHAHPAHLGAAVPLRGERILGRRDGTFGPGSMDDALLSRRHLVLRWSGRSGRIEDLGSLNGTTLNGVRVQAGEVVPGDVVGLGHLLLMVLERRPASPPRPSRLVGRSAAVSEILRQVDLVAPRETPVLLLGETGTGKELVAREVHDGSGRSGPFVALNCGAVGDELVQSELFGHARGAFTGADRASEGLFVAAHEGTLFLDEIGDLSLAHQAKLLRVLETMEVRAVGSDRPRPVDVRLVAATHTDLRHAVAGGTFRLDLYFRLAGIQVRLPALRERGEDTMLLSEHFLAAVRRNHGLGRRRFSPQALEELSRRSWPGNVRELRRVVESAAMMASGPVIEVEDLGQGLVPLMRRRSDRDRGADPRNRRTAEAVVVPVSSESWTLEEAERRHVARVLGSVAGNRTRAAKVLGVSRRTLYRLLERHDLD